jgi:hypothetical protein
MWSHFMGMHCPSEKIRYNFALSIQSHLMDDAVLGPIYFVKNVLGSVFGD